MADPLLLVEGLCKEFSLPGGGVFTAVADLGFQVYPREAFALVGESGCGKSTAARCILRLIEPTAGSVRFDGRDVLACSQRELRGLRREMQIIFQDPYSSLNPRMNVRAILQEPLDIHGIADRDSRRRRVLELLDLVGLPQDCLSKYPHEFSGGQRQRIGIARALSLSPRLVIADEPVSALDLSIRAQVINLLSDLQDQMGLAYVFIAHDLTLVRHVCSRVAVMRAGRIVEMGATQAVFEAPAHDYTRRLLAAIPSPVPGQRRAARPSVERPGTGAQALLLPLREVRPAHWARV